MGVMEPHWCHIVMQNMLIFVYRWWKLGVNRKQELRALLAFHQYS